MKCPSCGAEIGTSKVCEFCGSTITTEMQREAEQLRKEGCPKCGSSNITFRRENQGEVRGKNQKAVIHRTVGLCKDCGFTWYPNEQEAPVRQIPGVRILRQGHVGRRHDKIFLKGLPHIREVPEKIGVRIKIADGIISAAEEMLYAERLD